MYPPPNTRTRVHVTLLLRSWSYQQQMFVTKDDTYNLEGQTNWCQNSNMLKKNCFAEGLSSGELNTVLEFWYGFRWWILKWMIDLETHYTRRKPKIEFHWIHPKNHFSNSHQKVSRNGLTPEENQSPSGVGVTRDLMASTIETAVDAAEDLPHFWISTPPLCKLICWSLSIQVNNYLILHSYPEIRRPYLLDSFSELLFQPLYVVYNLFDR